MGDTAVRVSGLGKLYRVGPAKGYSDGLRHALGDGVRRLGRRLLGRGGPPPAATEFWALRGVSFDVRRGECVGVIGRNGAGKSTLLKVLSRITEPTEGEVRLRGRVGSLLEVGTGFHPELTGRENIYLNGSILGMSRKEIRARFDEIVAFSEVDKFLDTPVKWYSSGMYVRLAFAVAAHLEPEVLIVDEVLAVGDSAFQEKCLGKMGEVTRGGRTVLFVSHNMAAVQALCSSCCVLAGGRVAYHGPVAGGVAAYMGERGASAGRAARQFDPSSASPRMVAAALTTAGRPADTVRVGDPLELAVTFARPSPVQYPNLGVVLIDAGGRALLHASTRFIPCEQRRAGPDGDGTIRCHLGAVPLAPGRYHLSLALGDIFADTHEVPEALSFEVVEHSPYGDGKVPPAGSAGLWWPAKFTAAG